MGIIDVFTKIKRIFGVEEPKIEEKIAFNEIGDWIKNKRKEIESREKEIFVMSKNKISEISKELNEKVIVLEKVDINSKEVGGNVRLIVKENLNNYISYVKEFIKNLDNLKKEKFETFINEVDEIFLKFNKISYKSYQKSTFLVGKEIGNINGGIINLSRYLGKIFNENKDIIHLSKLISFIELKFKKLNEIKYGINEVEKRRKLLDRRIENCDGMKKKVLEDIEEIKKSKSYFENLKKQEEIELDGKELEEEIYKLKEMIDFKALGNIFHINWKKMNVITSYKKDFQTSFQENNGASILSLLNEAKLNNDIILVKINQINNMKKKIVKNREAIKKDETEDLSSELRRIKLEIESLNNENGKELKIYEKLKTSREGIISSIKQELAKTNVVVS